MSEKKQTSYKVLMALIVLMFGLQTIHNVCNWYIAWLGFVYYGNAPDQALDAFEVDEQISLTLLVAQSMFDLLATLRLAIADSILVSTIFLFQPTLLTAFILKVWRCWVICNSSWRAAIVPLVLNLGAIGRRWVSYTIGVINNFSSWDNNILFRCHSAVYFK
jgi:hypothetical protein